MYPTALTSVGLCTVLTTSLLVAIVGIPASSLPLGRAALLTGGCAVAIMLIGGSTVFVLRDDLPKHVVSSAGSSGQTIDSDTWTWQTPDGEYISDVWSAGRTMVVGVGDGLEIRELFGVDSATGEVEWQYRSSEIAMPALSSDGTDLAFPERRNEDRWELRVLDPKSGIMKDTGTARALGALLERPSAPLTPHGVISTAEEGRIISSDPIASSSGSGDWRYEIPAGCMLPSEENESSPIAAVSDTVIVSLYCTRDSTSMSGTESESGTVQIVALDAGSGRTMWTDDWATGLDSEGSGLNVLTGSDEASLLGYDPSQFLLESFKGQRQAPVFSPEEGEVLGQARSQSAGEHIIDFDSRQTVVERTETKEIHIKSLSGDGSASIGDVKGYISNGIHLSSDHVVVPRASEDQKNTDLTVSVFDRQSLSLTRSLEVQGEIHPLGNQSEFASSDVSFLVGTRGEYTPQGDVQTTEITGIVIEPVSGES